MKRIAVLLMAAAVASAAFAEEVRFGEAVVVAAEGPGFCGCMPQFAFGDLFDAALAFQRTVSTWPAGREPWAMAFGPNGTLYAAQTEGTHYTVVRYDAAGNRIGTFGDAMEDYPHAMAFDTRGDLIVAQQWSGIGPPAEHTLIIFDAGGRRIGTVDLPMPGALDVDVAADGCTAIVAWFQFIGTTSLCAAAPSFSPLPFAAYGTYHGVRFLPNGHILVSNADPSRGFGQLQELDRDGRLVRSFPGSEPLTNIMIDPDGHSFRAAGAFSISRYSLDDGSRLSGPVRLPHGDYITATALRGEWRAATSTPHHHRAVRQ